MERFITHKPANKIRLQAYNEYVAWRQFKARQAGSRVHYVNHYTTTNTSPPGKNLP